MTVASIVMPNWISYTTTSKSGDVVYERVGLHQVCTASGGCVPFPDEGRCDDGDLGRYFCAMWRTTGFIMSLATVMELVTVVGFAIVMAGGRMKRQSGWRVLCVMLGVVAALQLGAISAVVSCPRRAASSRWRISLLTAMQGYLFDNHNVFHVPGYAMDASWYLCTASASIALLCAFGLAISAYVLSPEDGYELLADLSGGV